MWNMMCDVMPTISEDGVAQRAASQFATAAAAAAAAAASGNGEDEANFEQLMVSMLDERDKLGRNADGFARELFHVVRNWSTFRGWKEISRRACIVCQVESLKNEQEKTTELEAKMKEVVKERDSLNRQLSQSLPQVRELARLSQSLIAYCFIIQILSEVGICSVHRFPSSSLLH